MENISTIPKKHFFICHASEDKEPYAIPLWKKLEELGISCWINEGTIDLGDNVVQKIQDGLIGCRYALIILSKNMINKEWPKFELSNLLSMELRQKKTIVIPLIIGNKEDILNQLPLLESKDPIQYESIDTTVHKLSEFIKRQSPSGLVIKDKNKSESKNQIEDNVRNVINSLEGIFDFVESKQILLDLKKINRTSYDDFSDIYQHILKIDNEIVNEKNIFDHVFDLIQKAESKFPISILGYPGTGKTKFLVLLYSYLKILFETKKIDKIPIYLNLNKYDAYDSPKSQDFFRADFDPIKNYIQKKKINAIYIIDGFNDYFKRPNDNDESIIDLLNDNHHVKIVSSSIFDNKYVDINKHKKITHSEFEIQINNVDRSNPGFNKFINAYLKTKCNKLTLDSTENSIKQIIDEFGILSLDLFSISLIFKKVSNRAYSHCVDFVSLIEEYILNHPLLKSRITIEKLSEYAFSIFMEEHKKTAIKNQYLSVLLLNNFIIRDYLLAKYIIQNLLKAKANAKDIYNQVFPYEVNKYCKQIINKNQNNEKIVYNSIVELLSRDTSIHIKTKTHFCYLLGRIKNQSIGLKAIAVLRKIKKEYLKIVNPEKEILLLLRTIYISLIFLGEKDNSFQKDSDEYILKLIESERWNNLNRGFHLEYYGDIPFNPREVDLLKHEDNLDSCEITFERLYSKIINYIKDSSRKYSLFEVEVFTLCSLVQHRVISNRTRVNEKIEKGYDTIIESLLYKGSISISENLRKYLVMLSINRNSSVTTIAQFAFDLYHIKSNVRTGWLKEGMNIDRPESISDHIMGTVILAKLFLPDSIHDEAEYCKTKIIDILLFHDIGEAYTTDIPKYKKKESHRDSERKSIEYISALSTYDNISNLMDIETHWKNTQMLSSKDINYRIAKEIDRLDNLLQLYIYKKKLYN